MFYLWNIYSSHRYLLFILKLSPRKCILKLIKWNSHQCLNIFSPDIEPTPAPSAGCCRPHSRPQLHPRHLQLHLHTHYMHYVLAEWAEKRWSTVRMYPIDTPCTSVCVCIESSKQIKFYSTLLSTFMHSEVTHTQDTEHTNTQMPGN